MKSYDSINNCPIALFESVLSSGKVELVGGLGNWTKIYSEYIEEFGVSDEYKTYWQALCSWAEHMAEYWLTKNAVNLTFAELAKIEANAISTKGKESKSVAQTAAVLSKKMGFRIDINIVTVSEFYNYIKLK